MADDRLTASLQESILALIATNNDHGRIAAGLLDSNSFDETYKDFAARILNHHKKHGRAPGKEHLDDVVDDVLSKPDHKRHKQYVRIIDGVLSLSDGLNAEYLLGRIQDFSRRQHLKGAILKASERYQQGGEENLIEDVEQILLDGIKLRTDDMSGGLFLNDKAALGFLDNPRRSYLCGIKEFDAIDFGPAPGEMLLMLAPKGAGKSWWAIDLGKRCLLQNARVLHVTLEMPVQQVIQRYFQNFFAITKRRQSFEISRFKKVDGELVQLLKRTMKARRDKNKKDDQFTIKLSLNDPNVRKELLKRQNQWGARLGKLHVKHFPSGTLTPRKLDAYIDQLELTYGFVPEVLIVDYPDLMQIDMKNPRLSIGKTFVDIRGILEKRNLAGIVPTQTNRRGWDAPTVKGSMVGEDATKFMTTDMGVIYSQTKEEKQRGLARLFIEKHRTDKDGITVVITQSYSSGQFVLDSSYIVDDYYDWLNIKGRDGEDSDDEDSDD